jgi:hypothetical protein
MFIIFRYTRPTFKRGRRTTIFSPSYFLVSLNLMSFPLSLPRHHRIKTREVGIPFCNELSDKMTTRLVQTTDDEVGPIIAYRIKDDAHNGDRPQNDE